MLKKLVVNVPPEPAQIRRGAAKIDGVPVGDGADNEVEVGRTERPTIRGAIGDFTALVEEYGALKLMSGFALVEPGLATPAKWRARIPLDHGQGSLDTAISRSALAQSLDFDEADNLLRIIEGETVRVVIDAAKCKRSS